ncbi:hypothetical protein [Streptomyces griseoluteus]|uniref:hypothetical protein n=1 Tax=Streptomyces griseoluteus TaxID=29306 RepID=UPI0036E28DE7
MTSGDRRVIGFLPTKVKALPGDVWFDRPRSALRSTKSSWQVAVSLESGSTRHLHLSKSFPAAARSVLAGISGTEA